MFTLKTVCLLHLHTHNSEAACMLFLGVARPPSLAPSNSETSWTSPHYPEISTLVGDACFLTPGEFLLLSEFGYV